MKVGKKIKRKYIILLVSVCCIVVLICIGVGVAYENDFFSRIFRQTDSYDYDAISSLMYDDGQQVNVDDYTITLTKAVYEKDLACGYCIGQYG